jgi:hypothetical protein
MVLFSIQVQSPGQTSGSDLFEIAPDEAWGELTGVCADLIGTACRGLEPNTEWKIELLDQTRKPAFRIRLVAETPK